LSHFFGKQHVKMARTKLHETDLKENGLSQLFSGLLLFVLIAHDNITNVLKLDKVIQNVFEIIEGDQQCN